MYYVNLLIGDVMTESGMPGVNFIGKQFKEIQNIKNPRTLIKCFGVISWE